MINFTFHSPTKLILGRGAENDVGSELISWGAKRVLVVYDMNIDKVGNLQQRIRDSLDKAGLFYVEKGGVKPNPRVDLVNECAALGKSENIDFLLAVGGGSVIDTAKAAALALASGLDDAWPIYSGEFVPESTLPVGVVLTICASGSESSWTSVITNEQLKLKRSFTRDFIRPKFAVMNPEVCRTLPKFQKACGIVDTMMHTLDRYFSSVGECTELTDSISEALLRTTVKYGPMYYNDPENYNAQAQIMWAANLSHNGITGCGLASDWACHQIEHEISGIYDVAHGAGLTAVWGSWARYVSADDPSKFARYARNVWMVNEKDERRAADMGIKKTEELFVSLGLPIKVSDLGMGQLPDAELKEMAEKSTFYGKRIVGNYKKLTADDIYLILKAAN